MRPELIYLRSLDPGERETSAHSLGQRVFDAELNEAIHHAYHSRYHTYVKANGYPIPDDIYKSTFHISRLEIENELRKQVNRGQNIVVLGCEGSGKTTLIHHVLGRSSSEAKYFYLDASDFSYEGESSFQAFLRKRLLQALVTSSPVKDLEDYELWRARSKELDIKLRYLISSSSTDDFVEDYLVWLSLERPTTRTYLVIDNIDSLNQESAQTLFYQINSILNDVRAKLASGTKKAEENFRLILSCRTATFNMISSASQGFFPSVHFEILKAEDDLRKNLSIADLVANFILSVAASANPPFTATTMQINFRPGVTETLSLQEYVELVRSWLKKSGEPFDRIIKNFCGRSIRRMKLYGIRAFSNPVLALVARLESRGNVKISGSDPSYVERRLYEALFDFRVSGKIGGAVTFGLPMNPFQVVDDLDEYMRNPLIGVVALTILRENYEGLLGEDIFFAKTLKVDRLIADLRKIGYTLPAVHALFLKFFFAGVLRPIKGSPVLLHGNAEHQDIHSDYVLDDRALRTYELLVFCSDMKVSMPFLNAAVRYHYELSYFQKSNSLIYEAFLSLIFLYDVVLRERKLKAMNRRTGVLLPSYASRIREPVLRSCNAIIHDLRNKRKSGVLNTPSGDIASLIDQTSEMYHRTYRIASDVETLI